MNREPIVRRFADALNDYVDLSTKNMKRVRTTFRGYPDPEYGEGFAKFTDGTRTVIVAPWKG